MTTLRLRATLAALGSALLVCTAVSTADAQRPAGPLEPAAAEAEGPMVALTFDDGPSEITPLILDALDRHEVTATFFMQGSAVTRHQGLAADVADRGHVVGNHGFSHRDFTTLDVPGASREITVTNRLIRRATGSDPVLFRYPFGRESEAGNEAIRANGMQGGVLWHWSAPLPGDFECPGAEAVADYVAANATDQAIILLHDGNETVDCGTDQLAYLDEVIPELKAQGFSFGVVVPADSPSPVNQNSWVRVVAPEEALAG